MIMEQNTTSAENEPSLPATKKLPAGYYLARFKGSEEETADLSPRPYFLSTSRSDIPAHDVLRRTLIEHDGRLVGRWYEYRQNFDIVRSMTEEETLGWLQREDAEEARKREILALRQLLTKYMPDLEHVARTRYTDLYRQ
jgi:hypothetical protein